MKVTEIKDKYNPEKIWIIKRSKCGHYYINQKICGKVFYSRFQRVTKSLINGIFEEV